MTYQEFKQVAEANALNDEWLFGEGWELIRAYPEYSDQLIAETLSKSFANKEAA